MPYMIIDHQDVHVPRKAKYVELDHELVKTPWSGLGQVEDTGLTGKQRFVSTILGLGVGLTIGVVIGRATKR